SGPLSETCPLQSANMFHRSKESAPASMRRLVKRLGKAGIPYAVMGVLAVSAHGHRRRTDDVDVLLTREGLEEFRRRFVPTYYDTIPTRWRRFIDRANGVSLNVFVTGHHPGWGEPGPITFPDPSTVGELIQNVFYINLNTLIRIKLAAPRHQDLADVVCLIE